MAMNQITGRRFVCHFSLQFLQNCAVSNSQVGLKSKPKNIAVKTNRPVCGQDRFCLEEICVQCREILNMFNIFQISCQHLYVAVSGRCFHFNQISSGQNREEIWLMYIGLYMPHQSDFQVLTCVGHQMVRKYQYPWYSALFQQFKIK